MTEDSFASAEPAWVHDVPAQGMAGSVVQLSSVRLRRNIEGFPFPGRCSKSELYDSAAVALGSIGKSAVWEECDFRLVDNLDDFSKHLLLEMNTITPGFMSGGAGRFLLRDAGGRMTCMINEEDHISISVTDSGLDLSSAFETVGDMERSIDIKLARDVVLGYLTANPAYVGTGMTATVILHLPALDATAEFSGAIEAFRRDWGSLEAGRIRAFGDEPCGSFYAVSNKITLSVTPGEIMDAVYMGTQALVSRELFARNKIRNARQGDMTDKFWRAWGLLRHAKKLSFTEALDAFSLVKLGADIGVLPGIDDMEWRRMIIGSQKYHLSRACPVILEQSEEQYARAALFRQFIENLSSSVN
jgi:protein arginine kinase